ncbi:disulfide bond formation protein B [Candidatus Dojkabacteria bacterium]|uniref:Disulfide bond formation protein B n=1 Tax=Candidatus Dojkabacteria bacterium TaxID=2099670 RepID=A0A3M0Z048_9BACT|nr:MAG: disulfide bond formation protein B [Candidatus Dojkabacteria bacterium]
MFIRFRNKISHFFYDYSFVVFLVSSTGMFGSLYFSELANYEPCSLCYLQRYFLYPMVFLSAWEVITKKKLPKSPIIYILLSFMGLVVSLYHNYLQLSRTESFICTSGGVSCSKIDLVYFFGIPFSIPFMSLVAFLSILVLSIWGMMKVNTVSRYDT